MTKNLRAFARVLVLSAPILVGTTPAWAATPVAQADYFAFPETTTTPLKVLKNDSDADGDELTITAVDGAGLSIAPDGRSLYFDRSAALPLPYATGSYVVSDGTATATAALSLSTARRAPKPPAALPAAFQSSSFVIDPINNFYDFTSIHYDSHTQRQRVGITFTNPNETPLSIIIFLFPSEGSSYRVNPQPNGEFTCIRGLYDIPLAPFSFADVDTLFLGYERVAGKRLERWRVETELTYDVYTGYRRSIRGTKVFVPYSIHSYSKSAPGILSNFLMYADQVAHPQGLPDQSVFDLPAVCSTLPPST